MPTRAVTYSVTRKVEKPKPFPDGEWAAVERELYGPGFRPPRQRYVTYTLTAKAGGRRVGHAVLIVDLGVAILDELIVHHDHRGEGIGRELLLRCETLARRHRCHKLTLETDDGLKEAIKLYRSAGFRKEATLPRHYGKRPTTIYGKRLD
jgi:ribosomal protein S18 acetylase RimI-like enzyme